MKPILIIQNCKIESAGTILDYFNQKGISYTLFHAYTNSEFPDLENFDAVISLGCPHSVTSYRQHQFLLKLYAYVVQIVRINKPYLGICFGAQILAKVLGASVEPNEVKEIGTYNMTLTEDGKKDYIFNNIKDNFSAFQWHGDKFKIPFGATLLATSADCTNQAFRKNNAVGIQFHFEADINEIPSWCDTYADELSEFGKTKEEIITAYQKKFEKIKTDNFRLLENFLSTKGSSSRSGSRSHR